MNTTTMKLIGSAGKTHSLKGMSLLTAGQFARPRNRSVASSTDAIIRSFAPGLNDNLNLLSEISALKERVAKLEQVIEVVDELDWDLALSKAREFFTREKRKDVRPPELADYLGTSISQAADLCDALEREGIVVAK
jgi:hypothetical protein